MRPHEDEDVFVLAPRKLRAEMLAAIETVKRLDAQRLEPMQRLRETANALISNLSTPPELIARIEADFASIRESYAKVGELMQATADLCSSVDIDQILARLEAEQ